MILCIFKVPSINSKTLFIRSYIAVLVTPEIAGLTYVTLGLVDAGGEPWFGIIDSFRLGIVSMVPA